MSSPDFASMVIYCPKCGSQMDTSGREFTCHRGQMGLSQRMRDELIAGFITPGVQTPPRAWSIGIGGAWFCPRDATRMVESDGVLACPQCGRSLNQYVYQLIELHPHRPFVSEA